MLKIKFKIVFVVDANSKIGMGHLIRCLALAEELDKKLNCHITFLIRKSVVGRREVLKYGFEVKKRLSDENADVIITSLPNIEQAYSKQLKKKTKLLVILDESPKTIFFADIVVRGTTVPEFSKRGSDRKIKFLLGPDYVILNDKLRKFNLKHKKIKPVVKSVLITVGGGDLNNLTPKIMSALNNFNSIEKMVIVGPTFRKTSSIARYKNYNVKYSVTNMAELMFSADLAISGGGMTLYELASVGTPTIVLCQTPDQLIEANIFQKKNAIINLGMGKKIDKKNITDCVGTILNNRRKRELMSRVGKKIIDGKGAQRIAKEIISEINSCV
ncbi:MAG: DUF354 domain-containing protein [Candidatus Staskawiczbacteria bacterium]|nr:DUF354 domain-containing protein [Candidatus Staskawiczbacteria bacterium]